MKSANSIDRVIQVNDINIGKNIARLRTSMDIKQTDMVAKLQVLEIDISIFIIESKKVHKIQPYLFYVHAVKFCIVTLIHYLDLINLFRKSSGC